VRPVDRPVVEVLARAAARDLPRALIHRELLFDVRPLDSTAGREDDLEEALGATEALARRYREPPGRWAFPTQGHDTPVGQASDLVRALAQRVVHLAAELGPHAEVDRHRGHHDHQGDRERRGRGDARAQAHGARST
jgi:hypothetical protein